VRLLLDTSSVEPVERGLAACHAVVIVIRLPRYSRTRERHPTARTLINPRRRNGVLPFRFRHDRLETQDLLRNHPDLLVTMAGTHGTIISGWGGFCPLPEDMLPHVRSAAIMLRTWNHARWRPAPRALPRCRSLRVPRRRTGHTSQSGSGRSFGTTASPVADMRKIVRTHFGLG